jgi:hypothetical protein
VSNQELDDALANEWRRRRGVYLQARKPLLWALLILSLLLGTSLFLPIGSPVEKIALWLVAFSVLFAIDSSMVHRGLKCPNCGKVPFLS